MQICWTKGNIFKKCEYPRSNHIYFKQHRNILSSWQQFGRKAGTYPSQANYHNSNRNEKIIPLFKATNLFWSDCNLWSFNCRVTSWAILIDFQYSTNIQSPLQLFQLKHAQSEQTPTNSNKACVFQANFNFSEGTVLSFWPIEFLSTEKDRIWSKCNYFTRNS